MIQFVELFQHLRFWLVSNGIRPEDVKITFSCKDAETFSKFEYAKLRERSFVDMLDLARPRREEGLIFGIPYKNEIAKPEKDGKDFCVDVACDDWRNLDEVNRAIKGCIDQLDRVGVKPSSIVLAERRATTDDLPWYFVRAEGCRI